MKTIARAFRRFTDWLCSRPTMAAIIAESVAHNALDYDWFSTIALTGLVYWFVSDGDKGRSNISITVEPNATTDYLYRVAKRRSGPGGGA